MAKDKLDYHAHIQNWAKMPLNDLIEICRVIKSAKHLLMQRIEIASMARVYGMRTNKLVENLIRKK
jgi:hypothetical protein